MTKTVQPIGAGLLAPVGAVVFTGSWVVLSMVSDGYQMWDIVIAPYSSIAQPISGLGLGSTAPYMNTAFVVCGAFISLGTWSAMRSWPDVGTRALRWARRLIPAAGIGMALCGIFDLESIMVHTLGFVIAAGGTGIGSILASRALRGSVHQRLSTWLRYTGPFTLVGMIAFMATFNAEDAGANVGYAGIVERVLVTVMMISMGLIGLSGARKSGSVTTDAEAELSAGRNRR